VFFDAAGLIASDRYPSDPLSSWSKIQKGDLPMKTPKNIDVLFVAGFGPIVRDPAAKPHLLSRCIGTALQRRNQRLSAHRRSGWRETSCPLAARPGGRVLLWHGSMARHAPVPQAWIEFDVGNIETATAELKSQGYKLLVESRKEPWGQIVARLLVRKASWWALPLRRRCGSDHRRPRPSVCTGCSVFEDLPKLPPLLHSGKVF